MWGRSSIVTEEQDTTQVLASLTDSSDGPVSREALYEMVWSEPMLRVADRFSVSSSYMARVCTLLNVPWPERGYWAKLAVGKAPKQPPLPEPRPGDPLEWTRDGALPKRARFLPKPPDQRPRRKRTVQRQLPDRHPLVSGAKPLFEAVRLSWHGKYLKPAKKLLVDLAVTQTGLDKSIAFANGLFLALEAREHRVVIAPNSERFHRAKVDERENCVFQGKLELDWSFVISAPPTGCPSRRSHLGVWTVARNIDSYEDIRAAGAPATARTKHGDERQSQSNRYISR